MCLVHAPTKTKPIMQVRAVTRIEPVTLCFVGRCPTNQATLVRALGPIFLGLKREGSMVAQNIIRRGIGYHLDSGNSQRMNQAINQPYSSRRKIIFCIQITSHLMI